MQIPSPFRLRTTAFATGVWIALLMRVVLPSEAVEQSLDRHRILVLNSYHIDMTWEDRLNEGMVAALRESTLSFDIFIEYMRYQALAQKAALSASRVLVRRKIHHLTRYYFSHGR